jgi:hypothetical protein
MQIVRTEVAQATTAGGHTVLRVTFCGEGSDCVTVDMATFEPGNDDAAIGRARAMLMQTATFALAENDYDAESNGNFDEVKVTAATRPGAGLYVFEYREGEGSRQVPPSTMPSIEAARYEALRGAIDLLIDLQPETDDLSGWLVRVLNEGGELICTVDVTEAQAALQQTRRRESISGTATSLGRR